jgi:hypothetical protein
LGQRFLYHRTQRAAGTREALSSLLSQFRLEPHTALENHVHTPADAIKLRILLENALIRFARNSPDALRMVQSHANNFRYLAVQFFVDSIALAPAALAPFRLGIDHASTAFGSLTANVLFWKPARDSRQLPVIRLRCDISNCLPLHQEGAS